MGATEDPDFNHIPLWLETNKDKFAPPVCNKLMHGPDGQLFVMYVGGPNQRKDFHLEEGEELFYMVKGMMVLKVHERGEIRDIPIQEGDIFLLPARIPHSPQRYENTIGLVIERQRLPTEKDCIRYFVDGTANTLYERWIQCVNVGTQIAEIIKEYFQSPEYATGKPQGTKNSSAAPPFLPDSDNECPAPVNLLALLKAEAERIRKEGRIRLYDERLFQTDVFAAGGKKTEEFSGNQVAETWVWQVQGSANFTRDEGDQNSLRSRQYVLEENSSILVKIGESFAVQQLGENSYTLLVTMDPRNKSRLQRISGP